MPLHVADTTMFWGPASGGVRRYVGAKRRWLQAHGFGHSTVVPGLARDADVAVPSLPLPFARGYRLARSRRRGAAILQQLAPDLIEAGDPYTLAWSALDAARALRIPAVAFMHSDLPALAARAGGVHAEAVAWRYLRRLYARFDLVLAPSAALCARLRAAGIDNAQRQPLGVDTLCFTPGARDPAWRAQIGVAPWQRVALFAGRFALEKNLPWLAAAVAQLGPRYVLALVGDGPVQLTGEHLRVLPFTRQPQTLARALASCDVFVHAGDIETFGLAPLEAMACGTPAVVRARGGLAELVDQTVGAAVASADPAAFAAAIHATCERDRAALSHAARQRARAYDWNAVLPALLARYTALCSARYPAHYAARAPTLAGDASLTSVMP
jgi:alpha-1,6-mannosyltransferase